MTNAETPRPQLTLDEQRKILLRAYGLIKEPDTWVRGTWKCPAYKRDANGLNILDKEGEPVTKTNANGQQLFQYCVEGAVNQATYDVVGEERALALGAVQYIEKEDGERELNFTSNETRLGFDPTELLGLDAISEKLYGMEAMAYNDLGNGDEDEDEEPSTHEGVLAILRKRLDEVNDKLAQLTLGT